MSSCTILVAGDDNCAISRCTSEQPEVQFPFTLEGYQNKSCGYPGFNLSCHGETESTLIDLGAMGRFSVRSIDYINQEVQIYDPDNCLPRRLMNFDLTGTPFVGNTYQNFDVYNCPSNFSSNVLEPISCLGTPNHSVYALSSFAYRRRFDLDTACKIFGTASVPTPEFFYPVTDLTADLHLVWDTPNCGDCFILGGTCRFKNRNKNEIECYNPTGPGLSKLAKYVLAVGIGLPALLVALVIGRYLHGRSTSNNGNIIRHSELSASVLPQPPIFIVGLEETVIQSYPKVVLGESRRLVKPEDNICSICLSEYRAKETIKTIPDCKHCFHAACIDQWLRRNVTCPLCRNAAMAMPMPKPVPVPPPESHQV